MDDVIVGQLHDPEHGEWLHTKDTMTFKPKPTFFGEVEPMQLVEFFNEHAPEGVYLDMGDYA